MDININDFNEIKTIEEKNAPEYRTPSFYEITKLVTPLVIFTVIFASAVRLLCFYWGFT